MNIRNLFGPRRTGAFTLGHWAVCAAALLLAAAPPRGYAASQKLLIHDQSGSGTSSRTGPILNNLAYIDSLPFDGITLNIPATWSLLAPGNVASYSDLYNNWLAPLKGKLHNVTHNYVKVVVRGAADPFDDWTQVIANWVALAKAARDAGLEGIWFDNEEYFEKVWDYPGDCKYGSSKGLSQYQEQYRLRGQQVMQAIVAQWPACKLLHDHGPEWSDTRAPASLEYQTGTNNNSLAGYFFAGMFAAAPGQVLDGGEHYDYRSSSQFAASYTLRKTTMSGWAPLCPATLASTWRSSMNISFGCYDQAWGGQSMDPNTWQGVITEGLTRADYLVWTYAESHDYLTPGAVSQDWISAIWNARRAAGLANPSAR